MLSLPSGYQRDLQDTKPPVLRAFGRGLEGLALVPALLANIEANGWHAGGERVVRCQELTWARTLSGLPTGSDLVLCSDCLNPVYGTEHAAALAATIHALLSRAQAQHGAQCLLALD